MGHAMQQEEPSTVHEMASTSIGPIAVASVMWK